MIDEMYEEEEIEKSTDTLVEVQQSLLLRFGDTFAPKEETIVTLQDVSKYQLIQGMHTISSHIVLVPLSETYGEIPSGLMHDQGLEHHADLEYHHITAQRTLDLIKEEMKNHPSLSLMNYIQPFELKCRVVEDGMSMILCTMAGYEFNIVPCFETTHVLPCRSTALLMRSNKNKRSHSLGE